MVSSSSTAELFFLGMGFWATILQSPINNEVLPPIIPFNNQWTWEAQRQKIASIWTSWHFWSCWLLETGIFFWYLGTWPLKNVMLPYISYGNYRPWSPPFHHVNMETCTCGEVTTRPISGVMMQVCTSREALHPVAAHCAVLAPQSVPKKWPSETPICNTDIQ